MLDALRDLRVKHLDNCKAKTANAFQGLYKAAQDQVGTCGTCWTCRTRWTVVRLCLSVIHPPPPPPVTLCSYCTSHKAHLFLVDKLRIHRVLKG